MKRILVGFCVGLLLCIFSLDGFAADLPYWKDLNVTSVNREQPRTAFVSYANRAEALTGRYEASPYYQLLNDTWKFLYVDAYGDLPDGVTNDAVNTDGWAEITVPGNWEVQGHGVAIYTNHGYEFKPRNPTPPLLPEANPVGVYRREFDLPAEWMERDLYLHLAGAKSGVYVYINGREVGYNEDSKNPAEFRINDYVHPGKNSLAVKIFRWSTGSYLECQDFFRLSGIERDVFIWSQPRCAVQDFRVTSTLDDSYTKGEFALEAVLRNGLSTTVSPLLEYELLDSKGRVVASDRACVESLEGAHSVMVSFEPIVLDAIQTWSAEEPHLYTLLMTLKEGDEVTEVIPFRVGFRRIEIRESSYEVGGRKLPLMYVNGQPIKLKGVNIHETSQYTGHYVTPEQMRRNFELMKQHNVNAVRTSHYPQDRRFYEMCDEYGFYVYDEANIESHGMYYDLSRGHTLGNNPDWLQAHLYRIENMYERNKNYPSVIIWSLGNEAGNGYNFYQAYLWLKERDRSRPVCYERALWEWNTDLFVPQYPTTAWLEEIGERGADRPVVPSEYAHAMGNSTGDLHEQWQAIYRYPQLQGGFIWDWIDQAILTKDAQGREFWAYGGDFGVNAPSDGNFMCNGLLNPDQSPHPAMAEVRYTHQNIAFEALDLAEGRFRIINRHYFKSLAGYNIRYQLLKDGTLLSQGDISHGIAPCDSLEIQLPVSGLKPEPGAEYFVRFEVFTKQADALIPTGHRVAYDQFQLPIHQERTLYRSKPATMHVIEMGDEVILSTSSVEFTFDRAQGIATSFRVDGEEYFNDGFGLQPNFWRAPTDNDYGNGAPKRWQVWKESSRNFRVIQCETYEMEIEEGVCLKATYLLPAGNHYTLLYRMYPSGVIRVTASFEALCPETNGAGGERSTQTLTQASTQTEEPLEVPRIGVRFRMPASMEQIRYFGRGPEENYCDRKMGTLVGEYMATASQLYYPYVRPQENGHHTDTRWLSASCTTGRGLLIVADSLMEFNALRNSVEDFDSQESDHPYQWSNFTPEEIANRDETKAKDVLRKQTHAADIVPRNYVEICLDMKQQGVGGYDSWGAHPTPEATIRADQHYEWSFALIPIASGKYISKKARLKY